MQPIRRSEYIWDLPVGYREGMRVPGRVIASEKLFQQSLADRAVDQVAAVATLPGIVGYSLGMPDIHWGYGFPIGGVAATEIAAGGVISPGGVGFDIGCGVRLLRSELSFQEFKPHLKDVVNQLGRDVHRGIAGRGAMPLQRQGLNRVLTEGAREAVARGAGWEEDLERAEDSGKLEGATPEVLSEHAVQRGLPQLGSLGAGNHFLEVQVVDHIYDAEAAETMELFSGQVCIMIHSGSRGLGHQVCTDHLKRIDMLMPELGIEVPDRQLACVPFDHEEAQLYWGAMQAAGNFARANRQVLSDTARKAFARVLGSSPRELGLDLVYDVAHNLAKIEEHEVEGRVLRLCVHRKGATRALPPGSEALPQRYRKIGQPVIIPGSMGSFSFVLTGSEGARRLTFASTCHGAGRAMSRTQAKKKMTGKQLVQELEQRGIVVAKAHLGLLSEEAPYAYKDPEEVVKVCEGAGLSKIVARLAPVGVVKG